MNQPSPSTDPVESNNSNSSNESNKKRMMLIVSIVILAIVLFFVGAWWFLYRSPMMHSSKQWAKEAFPFPVAVVNGENITIEEFEEAVDSTLYFLEQQETLDMQIVETPPTPQEVREGELEHLIDLALLQQIADEREITVTEEELQQEFEQSILPQEGNDQAKIEATLQSLYGWTLEDFKQRVLREYLLRGKVILALRADAQLNAATQTEAEEVYQQILADPAASFSDFAEKYSDDPGSASEGGMLGFFGKGVMVPEFEEAAFSLEVGEVSRPVQTDYGYHIIKVTNKDDAAGTIEARHILFQTKPLEEFLAEKEEQSKIYRFMPRYE